MSTRENDPERPEALIADGTALLVTDRPNYPVVAGGLTLEPVGCSTGRRQALAFLDGLPETHTYLLSKFVLRARGTDLSSAKASIAILDAVQDGQVDSSLEILAYPVVEDECLLDRFHLVVCQLQHRSQGCIPFPVADVNERTDLFHALVCLHFNDVRVEEHTIGYAPDVLHRDFLLKEEGVVVQPRVAQREMPMEELWARV